MDSLKNITCSLKVGLSYHLLIEKLLNAKQSYITQHCINEFTDTSLVK